MSWQWTMRRRRRVELLAAVGEVGAAEDSVPGVAAMVAAVG